MSEMPFEAPPTALLPHATEPVIGSRFAIALACWLLSSVGALMSLFMFTGISIWSLITQPISEVLQDWKFYVGAGIAYAWLALWVMTKGWIYDRQVAWYWPVLGGAIGILCCAFFFIMIYLYLPCALLGLYLTYFHLRSPSTTGAQGTL